MNLCEVTKNSAMVQIPKKKIQLLVKKRSYQWSNEVSKATITDDRAIPSSYGDRFIPRRYLLCNLERNEKFARKAEKEDILKTRFLQRNSQQIAMAISHSFGIQNRRILEFSDLRVNISEKLSKDNAEEVIHLRLDGYDWPCRPRSKPFAFTDTTHDLPGFDFSSDLNLVDWSVNDQIVASFGHDLIVWNRSSDLTMIFSIRSARAIAFCPNGTFLAVGCKSQCWPVLELWDITRNDDICVANGKVFGRKHSNIFSIEWSKSGDQIVCGTCTGTIYVLSVPDLITLQKIQKHRLPITMMKFSPNMRYLACTDMEGNMAIINWSTYDVYVHVRSRRKLKVTFDWHPWNGVDLAISEELPASIVILHVPSIEIVAYYQRRDTNILIDSVTFSKLTGELLVSVSENSDEGCINNEILVMSSLDCIVDVLKLPESGARFMMWSPDGTKLASTGNDETLTIWNFYSGNATKNKSKSLISCLCSKDCKQPFGALYGNQFKRWSCLK